VESVIVRQELHVTDRDSWRLWLEENHAREKEIWLVYFKKHTGKPRVSYDDAVEEALCFGWIDSTVRKVDSDRYCQKFTPRKEHSNWSRLNKQRVKKLIKNGRMAKPGLDKIKTAKANGSWDSLSAAEQSFEMPAELADGLGRNKEAKIFFDSLAPSFQKHYIAWVASARKMATKRKRASEALELLEKKQKLGMK
jgi:uncharacterized protein YdeI (YjbR/CyaY-like superfamily)